MRVQKRTDTYKIIKLVITIDKFKVSTETCNTNI